MVVGQLRVKRPIIHCSILKLIKIIIQTFCHPNALMSLTVQIIQQQKFNQGVYYF